MKLSHIFVAPRERRLRSGWRLLLQIILMLIITLLVGLVATPIVRALAPLLSRATGPNALGQPAGVVSMGFGLALNLIAITTSVYLARRFLDRRSFRSLGLVLDSVGRDLLVGFGMAAGMMAAIFVAELALGWSHPTGLAWQTAPLGAVLLETLVWLVGFVIVGWQEELLSRGYWLRNLTDGLNVPLALILSSLGFALLHLDNPHVSWTAVIGLLAAGAWLAYAALASGRLWLPIGAHIGWNFFEATVFGFPVSGLNAFGLLRQTVSGPELWTGGPFGPEAGLIVLPALALGTLAVWIYTHRRGVATE